MVSIKAVKKNWKYSKIFLTKKKIFFQKAKFFSKKIEHVKKIKNITRYSF